MSILLSRFHAFTLSRFHAFTLSRTHAHTHTRTHAHTHTRTHAHTHTHTFLIPDKRGGEVNYPLSAGGQNRRHKKTPACRPGFSSQQLMRYGLVAGAVA
ncbi:hypothetical protein EBO33_05510 [[Curtobacterium] plantarum]|nr:hypothetical protein EBO33_05510 [[Curtobacterium] plantarum]